MQEEPRFSWLNLLWFVLIVAVAAGTRFWYLHECVDVASGGPLPLLAQDASPAITVKTEEGQTENTTSLRLLIDNIAAEHWFATVAPLADEPEETAHVAPGYPWLVGLLFQVTPEEQTLEFLRWVQGGLGALTAGLYFLFALRAFRHLLVALLAGLLAACHPLWIINTAQLADGVLTTFLLAACLFFGTRSSQNGDPFSALLYGLGLAGLALVRAALLPFTLVGVLWFLARSRTLERGWLCAVVVVLGYLNGVAFWSVRNYQVFEDIVPMVDSAYVHLWQGNNALASGGPQDEQTLRQALPEGRLQELLAVEDQQQRYQALAQDVVDYVAEHPAETVQRRIAAGLYFFLGQSWFTTTEPGRHTSASATLPDWLSDNYAVIVQGVLLGMLLLAVLGWRWSYGWRATSGLAALAVMWVPLPYILSHAETLWGPRLPLDGILLTYAAFALVYLLPIIRGRLPEGSD